MIRIYPKRGIVIPEKPLVVDAGGPGILIYVNVGALRVGHKILDGQEVVKLLSIEDRFPGATILPPLTQPQHIKRYPLESDPDQLIVRVYDYSPGTLERLAEGTPYTPTCQEGIVNKGEVVTIDYYPYEVL